MCCLGLIDRRNMRTSWNISKKLNKFKEKLNKTLFNSSLHFCGNLSFWEKNASAWFSSSFAQTQTKLLWIWQKTKYKTKLEGGFDWASFSDCLTSTYTFEDRKHGKASDLKLLLSFMKSSVWNVHKHYVVPVVDTRLVRKKFETDRLFAWHFLVPPQHCNHKIKPISQKVLACTLQHVISMNFSVENNNTVVQKVVFFLRGLNIFF